MLALVSMGIKWARNLFLMVFSSRAYLCINVVGDHGFDYASVTTINDLPLGSS